MIPSSPLRSTHHKLGKRHRNQHPFSRRHPLRSPAAAPVEEESVLSAAKGLAAEVQAGLAESTADEANEKEYERVANEAFGPNAQFGPLSPVVLGVDDSPTVRKLVTMTLQAEGYRVETAEDAMAAIDQLKKFTPALILLDVSMPHLDGYKLCKLIKGQEKTKYIPVVMLSGKDRVFDKIRGQMAGCNGYLSKPFVASDLLKQVSNSCPETRKLAQLHSPQTSRLSPRRNFRDRPVNDNSNEIRVLVVDDSPTSLKFTVDSLSKAGFNTEVARDGDEATDLAESTQPDVIVLDIILPKKNGFQVCRELKANPKTRHSRIVLLSSKNREADRSGVKAREPMRISPNLTNPRH